MKTPSPGWLSKLRHGQAKLSSHPSESPGAESLQDVLGALILSHPSLMGATKAGGTSNFSFPHDQAAAPPPWAPAGTLAEQS